jgi:acyl carrier protein
MTREDVRQAIIEIISEILPDENMGDLDPQRPLRDQLELDSMDFLDIVMELRKRYSVEVPEPDYMELNTLDSTVNYLLPRMESI